MKIRYFIKYINLSIIRYKIFRLHILKRLKYNRFKIYKKYNIIYCLILSKYKKSSSSFLFILLCIFIIFWILYSKIWINCHVFICIFNWNTIKLIFNILYNKIFFLLLFIIKKIIFCPNSLFKFLFLFTFWFLNHLLWNIFLR